MVIDGPDGLKKPCSRARIVLQKTPPTSCTTYALGCGTEYYDQPVVREIRRQAERDDYKFFIAGAADS